MKRLLKINFIALSCFIVAFTGLPQSVNAEVMYTTFSRDGFQALHKIQPAYMPIAVVGNDLMIPDSEDPEQKVLSPLARPSDVFIDAKDHIYIADSGNNRIVHLDEKYEFVRIIDVQDSPLSNPQGVYVDEAGHIFIADTNNKRVVHLDADGNVLRMIGMPQSRYIPEDFKYDPIKIVTDQRGYLYIVTLGGYRGILQLDPDGQFQSFYGANSTEFSLLDAFKRMVYTREMYNNELSKLPTSISNIAIGPDGFVYTVTSEKTSLQEVKKLGFDGKNILVASEQNLLGSKLKFGEVAQPLFQMGVQVEKQLVDLAVDRHGNIAVVDANYKQISHYDAFGNLLYFWGGSSPTASTQLGLMKSPVSLAFNSRDELFVLDQQEHALQVFRLTGFGALINQANALTMNGFYEESEQYWQQVRDLNASYAPAILGLANAAYKKENYDLALHYYKMAANQHGYSNAYWQLRLKWFQSQFSLFATLFMVITAVYLLFGKFIRKRFRLLRMKEGKLGNTAMVQQLRHAWYMLRHPIDGFIALRYERKGGYLSATVLLAAMLVALYIQRAFTSFTFNKSAAENIGFITAVTPFVVGWLAWVVCNHLISSIYRGEGRFKDVFVGSSYALVPFILFSIPLTIISNGLTMSEQSIYNYILNGIYVWVGVMFFWMVQSIQNYDLKETTINLFLSLVAMVILGVLCFILFGLTSELLSFVEEVYREVLLR